MSAILPLLSFLLITISISLNNGSFLGNLSPVILLAISQILLAVYLFSPPRKNPASIIWLEASVIAVLAFFALIPGGWWINDKNSITLIQTLSSLLLLPVFFIIAGKKTLIKNVLAVFAFFLLYAFILRLIMLLGSPYPAIDVFIILKEAPQKILQAVNPYQTLYTYVFPGINPDYYAYWPASFILELPAVLIFNDPRYLLMFADLSAGVLLFILGGKNASSLLISILYFFRPMSLSITEASWLTPLNFFLITAIYYVLKKSRNYFLAGTLMGLLVAVQFFFFLLFIYLAKSLYLNKKFILSFFITVALFVLPFFLRNPDNFINQTVGVYFRNPPHPSILIHTSLSLNTLFYVFTTHDLPLFLIFSVYLIIFLITLRKTHTLTDSLLYFTLMLLTVFVFGRQAFINYYYLIASLLLLYLTSKTYADT